MYDPLSAQWFVASNVPIAAASNVPIAAARPAVALADIEANAAR